MWLIQRESRLKPAGVCTFIFYSHDSYHVSGVLKIFFNSPNVIYNNRFCRIVVKIVTDMLFDRQFVVLRMKDWIVTHFHHTSQQLFYFMLVHTSVHLPTISMNWSIRQSMRVNEKLEYLLNRQGANNFVEYDPLKHVSYFLCLVFIHCSQH